MTCTRGRAGRYCRQSTSWLVGNESTTYDISIIWIDFSNIILEIAVAARIARIVTRSYTASTVLDSWVRDVFTAGEKTVLCRVGLNCG